MQKLNDRQQLFCKYYAASNNATASYQQAYNCSYDTARVNGSKALTNTDILDYISQLKEIAEADRLILIDKLREENLKSIQDNLEMAKLLRDICFSKFEDFKKTPISESWLNSISRATEAIARLEEKAHNRLILISGIETAAEEILSNRK